MSELVFPRELINSAKSLKHLGILEIAWDWQNAIKAIEYLSKYNYVVLGGDVYNKNLEPTYDSWYINKNEIKSKEEFIIQAKKKAISYIIQYHDKNGDEYFYSIVYERI